MGAVVMKRSLKTASLFLAFAMIISVCSCSAKPSRSGLVHRDYEKTEGSAGETEPVVTLTPVPTGTATPTPTTAVSNGKQDPYEISVSELMSFSELCVGLSPDDAEAFLTAVLGISSYAVYDDGNTPAGTPTERFLRELDRDIVVSGVPFKSIGIHMNGNGAVVDVDYTIRENAIFAVNEAFDSESYYNMLYPDFSKAYGDPSDDYVSYWVDFDQSGLYGWKDGSYWVSLFWGMSCQSVKGNDQLVIGIEYDDPSNIMVNGGSTTRSAATSYNDVFTFMENAIGMDLNSAVDYFGNVFDVDLGAPSDTTKGTDGSSTYTYDVLITFDEYSFNEIELDTGSDNLVYHIGFINNVESGDMLHDYCVSLTEMTSDHLDESPTLEYPLSDDNSLLEFYDFNLEGGKVISVGAYYSDFYNSLWFTYEKLG